MISERIKERAKELREQGYSYGEIAKILNLPKSTVWYLINDPEWLSGREEREENEEKRFGEFEEMIREIVEREKSRSITDVNRLLLEAMLEREREEERKKRLLLEMLKLWAIRELFLSRLK